MESKIDQLKKTLHERGMEMLFARVASSLLEKGNAEEACSICEEALKKFPMYAQGHFVLANCYAQLGKSEQACSEYERVLKYDPNHLKALKNLAEIYQKEGMTEQSREKLAILQLLNPLDTSVSSQAKTEAITPKQEKKATAAEAEFQPDTAATKEKIDLSQFDNTEDDFTTIIHGKTEEPEVEKKTEETTINLGSSAADLLTDTEVDDRRAYEEEIRVRNASDQGKTASDKEFEDLDELKFDEGETKDSDAEKHEDWVEANTENDATEIIVDKVADSAAPPKKVKSKKSASDSDFQQPKIVTQTLGEILVSQKKYVEALRVFETLQQQNPELKNIDKKVEFLKKIVALEQK